MKTDTSRVSKAYRQIFFAVPLTVIALVALLVIASTNSSLLDRYFLVLMVLNLVAASVLVILTAWLCIRLFLQWRRHQFGSQMTLRLTIQITLIAVLPCLLLYAVSSRFIGRSIDSWFNVRVEHALDSGVNLSRTALANLRKQTAERVRILGYALADQPQFEWKIDLPRLRERYGLTNVMIANGKGEILTTAFTGPTLKIQMPAAEYLSVARLRGSYSSLLEEQSEDASVSDPTIHILAIAPIAIQDSALGLSWEPEDPDAPKRHTQKPGLTQLKPNSYYLVAQEPLPAELEKNISSVTNGYRDYQELVLSRDSLRSLFKASLTVSMLMAVLGAFIAAIAYAQMMVDPLRQLARGTRRVAGGNLSPIHEFSGSDEINMLTQSFNDMIGQLAEAQKKVQTRTEQLEQTSQYLESVLSNLSSGVVVIDRDMNIVTANEGAARILGSDIAAKDASLKTVAPQICSVIANLLTEPSHPSEETKDFHREIELARIGSQTPITLFVRASHLHLSQPVPLDGLVLVIDDMTQVISGQRAMAWGEVARRLAHEIKNPLTPIQLAAERLEMKLSGKLNEADSKLLSKSISTIVTQVSAMKQMVDDFRNYAKLPPAVLLPTDLNALLDDVGDLYRQAGKPVTVRVDPSIPRIYADEAQLRQVLHNLVSNSLDAMSGRTDGKVVISTEAMKDGGRITGVLLRVADNWTGFSPTILHKSFEPYITTKATGTGLGLPMVKKIVDEHKADIKIANRTDQEGRVCGALVTIAFRVSQDS